MATTAHTIRRARPLVTPTGISTAVLWLAVAYNAVVTSDVKLGGVPIKSFLLLCALATWVIAERPFAASHHRPELSRAVLVVGVVVPVIWTAVALIGNHDGDPAQRAGASNAVTEASHFLYVLLFFPLVDHFGSHRPQHAQRLWLWPALLTCAVTIGIWLTWKTTGFDYGYHQSFALLTGFIGPGPGGYRVSLVTQVLLIPALAWMLACVANDGATRGAIGVVALVLAATVLSHTRSYWLGMLVASGGMIVLTSARPSRRSLRLAALMAVLAGLAVGQVLAATSTAPTATVKQISISERLQEAHELLRGAQRHLLVGSGLGATLPDGYERSTSDPWSFELTYYQLLFELGIVGLLVVLSLPLLVVWRCWRRLPRLTGPPATYARVAIAGTLAVLVADSTNPYLINSVGMLSIAILAAMAALALSEPPAGRPTVLARGW